MYVWAWFGASCHFKLPDSIYLQPLSPRLQKTISFHIHSCSNCTYYYFGEFTSYLMVLVVGRPRVSCLLLNECHFESGLQSRPFILLQLLFLSGSLKIPARSVQLSSSIQHFSAGKGSKRGFISTSRTCWNSAVSSCLPHRAPCALRCEQLAGIVMISLPLSTSLYIFLVITSSHLSHS